MRVTELCPSPHLEALDCGDNIGDEMIVTIKSISKKEVGSEKVVKGVLYFSEVERGLVINKTNSRVIAALYGTDTDSWLGQKVALYRSETSYQGKVVPCIRVRDKAPSNGRK